jgi:hypothetical protein
MGVRHQDRLAGRLTVSRKLTSTSTSTKLTLHRALIGSVMTYACPAWEIAAEIHLLKLQRLQNSVLRTTGNFRRHTSVRDMHVAFQIPLRL